MKKGNTAGARYLRQLNHIAHARIWTDRRRALMDQAHAWLREGIPLDVVIRRIENITMTNGGRA